MTRHASSGALIEQLKTVLAHYRELGFDPPPIRRGRAVRTSPRAPAMAVEKKEVPRLFTLEDLRQEIGDCRRCKLHQGRKHLVFGEGAPDASLVFVGEGPGRDEDLTGRPFVGAAGELLTRIIAAMGLTREEVYICNIVKCRPPRNRDPEKDEVEACLPFLKRQLRILRPKAICVLGRVAGCSLIGGAFKISMDRGRWFDFEGIPLMPTYHPAFLLRNQSAKRQVWEDVQKIMGRLGLEVKRNG
ncbi:uracil-DNA glycosylase [Desulfatiglans anilini]|uniref:uracil-DNA glycosylase n=1 Tax=Desulfatiglans anilini TaxID=90728 RepID=UPI0003FB84B1|nr:uracil-DNA glycosylase [Desulfatiglans anilini]